MTPFAGDAVAAFEHAAVHHDAAAGARAENDAEHRARALGGAVGRFRQREAVGVVGHAHRPAERALEIAIERLADQPRRVRVLDQPGRGEMAPGMPMPTVPAGPVSARSPRQDRGSRESSPRSRRAAPERAAAATSRVPSSAMRFDFRPAEVDTDTHESTEHRA